MRPLIPDDQLRDDHAALVTPHATTSWRALLDTADRSRRELCALARSRVGLVFRATADAFAAALALDALDADVFLFSDALAPPERVALARQLALAAVVDTAAGDPVTTLDGADAGSGSSTVTILTSGTTGRPKAARHTWAGLARPARRTPEHVRPRWLLCYRPNLYAGLQVIAQCYVNAGTLVAPPPGASAADLASFAQHAGAQFASATPSWWRWLLTFADATVIRGWSLRQITLGGEAIDQAILDRLHEAFPTARLIHIYATTELGRCFSVTDGRAGFPLRFLEAPSPDGVELRIDGGELLVRSANAMHGYDPRSGAGTGLAGGFIRTGDLVEIRGDRVHFVGRTSDVINVGGNKVFPVEVERVIAAVPGVLDVRVFPKRSSIAGELVAAEIVVAPAFDPDSVKKAVALRCQKELPPPQRPRLIADVERIELTSAGKKVRREPA